MVDSISKKIVENYGRDVTHYTFENKQSVIGASISN